MDFKNGNQWCFMKKLLIATSNKSKKKEILHGLAPLIKIGVQLLTLDDVKIMGEPIESGSTFEENARIKAQFYAGQTRIPTLADDGGLMIDALNGAPGVISRRWPGYEATDRELIDFTLEKMKHIPKEKRSAQLKTCVCFYDPSTNHFVTHEQAISGLISEKPRTYETNGYPYRALIIVSQYNTFYDELTDQEHKQINHRLKAIRQLIPVIKEFI